MKALLDEMVPKALASQLGPHQIDHVADLGWQSLSNGKLLTAAEDSGFGALITKDSNMPYQQNLSGRKISIVVLRPPSQDIRDLIALAPKIRACLESLQSGSLVVVPT